MMIGELFNQKQEFKFLRRRRDNFRLMCQHVASSHVINPLVIETGTAWDPDNWGYQGQSTLIWDWLSDHTGCEVISIDIRIEARQYAEKRTKRVTYLTGNSISVLGAMPPETLARCQLLYLDSYDWTEALNIESAYHHMAELAAIYRLLPNGCMIVVDDRHGNERGKHWMVERFFVELGIKPVFRNHQVGFIKQDVVLEPQSKA